MHFFSTLAILLPLVAFTLCASVEKRAPIGGCLVHTDSRKEHWGDPIELMVDPYHNIAKTHTTMRSATRKLNIYTFNLQFESHTDSPLKTMRIKPGQDGGEIPDYKFKFDVTLKNGKGNRSYWLGAATRQCTNKAWDWFDSDVERVTFSLKLK